MQTPKIVLQKNVFAWSRDRLEQFSQLQLWAGSFSSGRTGKRTANTPKTFQHWLDFARCWILSIVACAVDFDSGDKFSDNCSMTP
jgi:hypothetical protein